MRRTLSLLHALLGLPRSVFPPGLHRGHRSGGDRLHYHHLVPYPHLQALAQDDQRQKGSSEMLALSFHSFPFFHSNERRRRSRRVRAKSRLRREQRVRPVLKVALAAAIAVDPSSQICDASSGTSSIGLVRRQVVNDRSQTLRGLDDPLDVARAQCFVQGHVAAHPTNAKSLQ